MTHDWLTSPIDLFCSTWLVNTSEFWLRGAPMAEQLETSACHAYGTGMWKVTMASCAVAACGFPRPVDVPDDAVGLTVQVSTSGDDANDGLANPVKTVKRAIGLAAANKEITMIAVAGGRYEAATGETFPYTVPPSVTVAGPAGGGAILAGNKAGPGLILGSGTLKDLEFEGFTVAVTSNGQVNSRTFGYVRAISQCEERRQRG